MKQINQNPLKLKQKYPPITPHSQNRHIPPPPMIAKILTNLKFSAIVLILEFQISQNFVQFSEILPNFRMKSDQGGCSTPPPLGPPTSPSLEFIGFFSVIKQFFFGQFETSRLNMENLIVFMKFYFPNTFLRKPQIILM